MKMIKKTTLLLLVVFATNFAYAQGDAKSQDEISPEFIKPKTMKTYLIERDMPGAGKLTQDQLKGASQKSCDVLKNMGEGIQWIQSYVTDDKVYCVYKAESKEMIKEHADKAGFPCNEIMEIDGYIGPQTAKE